MIERTNIDLLIERANDTISWLEDNVFHPDFYKKANQYAILTVRISNYYKNNKLS